MRDIESVERVKDLIRSRTVDMNLACSIAMRPRKVRQHASEIARRRVRNIDNFAGADRFARDRPCLINGRGGISHLDRISNFAFMRQAEVQAFGLSGFHLLKPGGVKPLLLHAYLIKTR